MGIFGELDRRGGRRAGRGADQTLAAFWPSAPAGGTAAARAAT